MDLVNSLETVVNEIHKTRKDIEMVKSCLVVHYHQLLKYGKDVRNEGLSWLIKSIWKLGHDVMYSCLPSFLDEGLIYYLFTFSKKEMELSNNLNQIKELIQKVSRKRKNKSSNKDGNKTSCIRCDKQSINVTDVDEAIKDKYNKSNNNLKSVILAKRNKSNGHYLNKIVEKNTEENFDKMSINQIKDYIELEEKVQIDNRVVNHFTAIKQLKAQCESLKNELTQMKSDELSRINQEFLLNDYERRFGVSQDIIVTAITGEEEAANILTSQFKEQKVYFKNLEKCRTFNFIQNKNQKKTGNLKKITINNIDIFVNN